MPPPPHTPLIPQVLCFLKDLHALTLEVVARCFLGEYATRNVLDDLGRLVPVLGDGILSVPVRFPWPLNRFPAFSFGAAMHARSKLLKVLNGVLRARRADLEDAGDRSVPSAGVLDSLLAMQTQQTRDGGPEKGQVAFDDEFIVDNVRMQLRPVL